MKLSIIIPVYYNEDNLPPLMETLKASILDKVDYELVFVDDGSGDNSYAVLLQIQKDYENIKVVKLSRNFGSHAAILAGLAHATGNCATVLAADLQEPPEMILQMLEKWQAGASVVLAVRQDRQESFSQKLFANTYYSLMKRFALKNMPLGGFDCFLIDKKVVNVLVALEEKNTTLMGQIIWCGFTTAQVYYVRKAREIGKSKWTFSKKIKLFIDSFLAFSYLPIRLMSLVGIMAACLGGLWGVIIVASRLINGVEIQGWASMVVILLITSGIQMTMLGVIGEYLWRTFDSARKRPPYIVEKYLQDKDDNHDSAVQ